MSIDTYEIILRYGKEAGFDLIGVAPIAPLIEKREPLEMWLKCGYNAGMDFFSRSIDTRLDPRHRFPWAKSIISVAVSYARPVSEKGGGIVQRIARYARGQDYHSILNTRLKALADKIQSFREDIQLKYYVDTGPVLEKEWAMRAGLGWIGKNTLLCHPEKGSYLVLGELLTSISFPQSFIEKDRCANCDACIKACPTGALVSPYKLDARRCLSFITIEYREKIPVNLANSMSGRLFGCDRCQEVCPWNQKISPSNTQEFDVRPVYRNLELKDIIQLSENNFRSIFRGSAILRAKWTGFMRNAIIASGAEEIKDIYDALKAALLDPNPIIRESALWVLQSKS